MRQLDKRLLSLLRMNARVSASALATELGVSRATVETHMRRLEKSNIISGYTVQLGGNYQKQMVSAHVLIRVMQKLLDEVCAVLGEFSQVGTVYTVCGDYDLIARVKAESVTEMNAFLEKAAKLDGVERINPYIILESKFVYW